VRMRNRTCRCLNDKKTKKPLKEERRCDVHKLSFNSKKQYFQSTKETQNTKHKNSKRNTSNLRPRVSVNVHTDA
jgi:hypothetical protein